MPESFVPGFDWRDVVKQLPEAKPIYDRLLKAFELPGGGGEEHEKLIWQIELAFDRCEFDTCDKLLNELGITASE